MTLPVSFRTLKTPNRSARGGAAGAPRRAGAMTASRAKADFRTDDSMGAPFRDWVLPSAGPRGPLPRGPPAPNQTERQTLQDAARKKPAPRDRPALGGAAPGGGTGGITGTWRSRHSGSKRSNLLREANYRRPGR